MVDASNKKLKLAVMRHGESELVKDRAINKKLIESDPYKAQLEAEKTFEEKERSYFE